MKFEDLSLFLDPGRQPRVLDSTNMDEIKSMAGIYNRSGKSIPTDIISTKRSLIELDFIGYCQ